MVSLQAAPGRLPPAQPLLCRHQCPLHRHCPHQASQHSGPRTAGGPGGRAGLADGGCGGEESLSSVLAVTRPRALHLLSQEILLLTQVGVSCVLLSEEICIT